MYGGGGVQEKTDCSDEPPAYSILPNIKVDNPACVIVRCPYYIFMDI